MKKEHIEHLAVLAKMDLSEEEKEKYAGQFGDIIEFVEQLNELETRDVEPMFQVIDQKNVVRPDEEKLLFSADRTLAEAPELDKNQIKVKAVFDRT
jgi:aspartyl-tRNA(Asn)/glutamyl-tRNA(Gln) amidotransferase subunit C